MNVLTRGVRNAFRNVIRTCSIVIILGLSMGLALAMLIANQAVSDKITSVKQSVGNTVSISPAGLRGFSGGGDPLTETQLAKIEKLAHVTSVDKSLSDRLTTENSDLESAVEAGTLGKRFATNDGSERAAMPAPQIRIETGSGGSSKENFSFTPPVMLTGTTAPTQLSSTQGGGTFTLKSGAAFTGTSADKVALIGSDLATKNSLKVGSTFTAYDAKITVAGIFDAGNSFANNQVIMPLKTVQELTDQSGSVTSATANVDSITNVASVTTDAQKALGDAADVTNDAARAEESIAPLENIKTISFYSLIGAVAAGAVIILLTMIMIVRERRREIGVIKAIGASNANVVTQFASEAITLTVLASAIGVVLGALAGSPITNMLVTNSANSATTISQGPGGGGAGMMVRGLHRNFTSISASVGWDVILYGLGIAIIIAIVGSALASFFISKIRPAEVMRAE